MKKTARILIVDDYEANVASLSHFFEKLGFETDKAVNGQMALELIRENNYDVIVSDINMSEMDGISLARNVMKSVDYNVKIILTSANDYPQIKDEFCFIRKPINIKELLNVLEINI